MERAKDIAYEMGKGAGRIANMAKDQAEKHHLQEKVGRVADRAFENTGVNRGQAKIVAIGATGVAATFAVASAIPTALAVGVVGLGTYAVAKEKAPEKTAKVENAAKIAGSAALVAGTEAKRGYREEKKQAEGYEDERKESYIKPSVVSVSQQSKGAI